MAWVKPLIFAFCIPALWQTLILAILPVYLPKALLMLPILALIFTQDWTLVWCLMVNNIIGEWVSGFYSSHVVISLAENMNNSQPVLLIFEVIGLEFVWMQKIWTLVLPIRLILKLHVCALSGYCSFANCQALSQCIVWFHRLEIWTEAMPTVFIFQDILFCQTKVFVLCGSCQAFSWCI